MPIRVPAPDAVLFDLDRTLVSLDVDIEAARQRLRELYAPLGHHGSFRPVLPGIDEAARAVAATEAERVAWLARGRAVLDQAERMAAVRPLGGAREALETLAARGIPVGVVTDNGPDAVLAAARVLPLEPRVVITRDHVTRPKPDPEGVARAAHALLPAGGTLHVIGDSVRDMAAAVSARASLPAIHVVTMAVATGRDSAEALALAGADHVLRDLAELPLGAAGVYHDRAWRAP